MPPLTPYLDPVGAPNYLDNWLDLLPLGLGCGVYIRLKTLNLVPNSKGLDLKPARRYWLPLQADLPNFGLKLSDLCRREIKRGAETLRIEISLEADVLHQMFKNALERKGLQLAVDPSVLQRLVGACSTHGQGAVYVAKDTTGNAVAAALVVWDHQNAYYLGGGGKGGVMRSLLWRAISDAAKKGLNFDFGGGEVAGVAQFYASFGAQLAVGSRLTYYKGPFSRFAIKLWKNARHSADRPFH